MRSAQAELIARKAAFQTLAPGAVTQEDLIEAELRVGAITSQHIALKYPGAGLQAQITSAMQVALAPLVQAVTALHNDMVVMQGDFGVMQQQIGVMQQDLAGLRLDVRLSDSRAILRLQNAVALQDDSRIHALPIDANGNGPANFPNNRGELKALPAASVDAILGAYNVQAQGDHHARRQTLAHFLGVQGI